MRYRLFRDSAVALPLSPHHDEYQEKDGGGIRKAAEKEAKGKYDGFEVKSNDKETPNPINEEYALKLIKEAKQQGVELLFVRTPDTTWHEDQHNYIQELADKNNIKFLLLHGILCDQTASIHFSLKPHPVNRKKCIYGYYRNG